MSQVKNLVDAIDTFIVGCKADGIWDPIKACCVMAAWDGLNGALIPLKGDAPTNFNFVSGDYDRKTGLKGDGSTKYLDSNRNNNDDPQDDCHVSSYRIRSSGGNQALVAARVGGNVIGSRFLWIDGPAPAFTCNPNADVHDNAGSDLLNVPTFQGVSRASSTSTNGRVNGQSYSFTRTSGSPVSNNLRVFCSANDATPELFSNARMSFYSIGEALDLAALDTRVSNLITAIGAAIP